MFVESDKLFDKLQKRVSVESLENAIYMWKEAIEVIGLTGNAIRSALLFIRFMFMSGLNNVTEPFSRR